MHSITAHQNKMLLRTLGLVFLLASCFLTSTLSSIEGKRQRQSGADDVSAVGKIRRYRSNNQGLIKPSEYDDDDDDNNDDDSFGDYEDIDPEDILNPTINEDSQLGRKQIDPKGSWLTFVRYSNEKKTENKPDKRKKKRNKKKRRKLLHGPPGPAGPPGPQGPPGQTVSKEEIIAELQALIKEATEKRVQEIFRNMVYGNISANESAILQPDLTSQLLSLPRVHSGFSLRLAEKVVVRRKTFTELMKFQQPFGDGSFQRGDSFNMDEGRFTAPKDGIYQFTANLHLRVRSRRRTKVRTKSDETIKLVVCIDSKCQTNSSIETISGIFPDTRAFTVSVSGFLQMKENQYASVYIDNSATQNVVVLAGSEYSGIFLGS